MRSSQSGGAWDNGLNFWLTYKPGSEGLVYQYKTTSGVLSSKVMNDSHVIDVGDVIEVWFYKYDDNSFYTNAYDNGELFWESESFTDYANETLYERELPWVNGGQLTADSLVLNSITINDQIELSPPGGGITPTPTPTPTPSPTPTTDITLTSPSTNSFYVEIGSPVNITVSGVTIQVFPMANGNMTVIV